MRAFRCRHGCGSQSIILSRRDGPFATGEDVRCRYCGCSNAEEDHRCQHCGRRLDLSFPVETSAALPQPAAEPEAPAETGGKARKARQVPLFTERTNVIPFETLAPGRISSRPDPAHTRRLTQRPAPAAAARADQSAFDFRPRAPQPRERSCSEAKVASAGLRVKAAALDAVLFAMGAGVAATVFHLMGGTFSATPKALYGYAGALGAMLLFYHLFWSVLGQETAGMRCFRLRLVTFDSLPPSWPRRVARLAAICLSLGALGIGLVWALSDEEHLAWHDHITKTFPTIWDPHPSSFQRK